MSTNKNLYPDRHSHLDIFLVDVFEGFKDDIASMEHPIFSLSKKPDYRIPEYSHNGKTIKISPSAAGLPTIFDKDILLYIASALINAKNNGEQISKHVQFTSYDYLVTTNKSTGGEQYNQMKASLLRLRGTSIETNIKTNDIEVTEGFGLIESYRVVKEGKNGKALAMTVKVSDWFYNSIMGNEVLTIDKGYFRLKKPTDRRLYELARKHCGNQNAWKISLEKLKVKLGTVSPLRAFRYNMKKLIDSNHLPEYNISMNEDIVTFTRKEPPKAPTKTQIDKLAKPGESYGQAKTRLSTKTGIKDMKKALGKR